MNEKSLRDQIWEKKRKEREDRLRLQREGETNVISSQEFDPTRGNQPPRNNQPIDQVHSPQIYSQQKRMEQIRRQNGTEPQGSQNHLYFPANQPVRGSGQFLPQQQEMSNLQRQQLQQQQQMYQPQKQQQTIDQAAPRSNTIGSEKSIQFHPSSESVAVIRSIDQTSQQQQSYNNKIQKQMAEQQRRKAEEQSIYEDDRRKKENYRRALQDQMKEKEEQAAHIKNSGNSVQEQTRNDHMQAVAAQQTKQDLADYLRFQMAQKNQQTQPDKKMLLQQSMEEISVPTQKSPQILNKGRSNPYNQTPMASGKIDNIAFLQGQQQQQQQLFAYQQQMQQMPIQSPQSSKYPHNKVNNNSIVAGRNVQEYQSPNIAHRQYAQPIMPAASAAAAAGPRGNYEEARAFIQASSSINNTQSGSQTPAPEKINIVRGNKNFIKVENADLIQVNRRQQQQQEYQKDLQRQIEEKARAKREEADKLRREEYMEEQRLIKEQEMLRRQLEEEMNPKQPGEESMVAQQVNEFLNIDDEDSKNKKNPRKKNPNTGGPPPPKGVIDSGSAISMASKDFLDAEKKNEGIDQHASIIDFYRKKQTSKQANQISPPVLPMQGMGPPINVPPQPNMNMMGAPNAFLNPMMYQNPQQIQMGQNGMVPQPNMNGMHPMMMMGMVNPVMQQQQQILANQQAQLIQPQLNELRMQMQQQQQMMQQQIDFIKNQANVANEEKNNAEQKYKEIKNQYEQKQLEEQRYTEQLNQAIAKTYDSSPKAPTQQPQYYAPNKSDFQNPNESPNRRGNSIIHKEENEFSGRRASPSPGQHSQNKPNQYNEPSKQVTFQGDSKPQPTKPLNRRAPSDDFLSEEKRKKNERDIETHARQSLASDNKFIPLDILDDLKRKEQNVTLSKLGNYGVNESQLHQNSIQQYPSPAQYQQPAHNSAYPKRPPSSINQQNEGNQWNIPSVNSDITKEIDGLLQRNLMRYAPGEKSTSASEPQGIYQSQYTSTQENFNPTDKDPAHATKTPLTRVGSSQQMRRTNRDQPFGAAARGILGDSRAFEQQQRQSNMGTFKTNSDQEGFKLGNDFPDFSINGKNNGFGLLSKDHKQLESNSSVGNLKGFGNSALKAFNTTNSTIKNQGTLNTNNFDIDKINQRNEERLQKLDKFGIQTQSGADANPSFVEQEEEGLDKLEFLLQKFNANNNIR